MELQSGVAQSLLLAVDAADSHKYVPVSQEDFPRLHGRHLRDLRGLRCPLRHSGDGVVVRGWEAMDWDVFAAAPRRRESPGLAGYTGLRTLALCQVLDSFAPWAMPLPALPASLRDLTLDSGPDRVVNLSGASRDVVDLRHLTALTRLTLVRLTPAVVWAGLLGCRVAAGTARLPPRLDTLRVLEPAADPDDEDGDAGRCINLGMMLRSRPPSLPPARFPTLCLRADHILCGYLEPWPAQPAPALPGAVRLRTRCLSLSPPGCKPLPEAADDGGGCRSMISQYGLRWFTPRDAVPVHPVEALCETVRSLPPGVEELGLGFADRQPLRLRLQLHVGVAVHDTSGGAAEACRQVSFTTATELADAVRQRAAACGVSCTLMADGDVEYVLMSRLTGAAAAVCTADRQSGQRPV